MLSGLGYLFGDMRWANLGLLALAGAALIWGRGKYGVLAAVLLLTTPRVLFVLEQAWTDAYIIGLLAVTVWTAVKFPRYAAFAFGTLVSAKQYMIFLMPLGLLLIPPPWDRQKVLRFVGEAVIAALVINLPWLLWNPKALIAATTVSGHPFRADSLSFLANTAVNGQPTWPVYIQLALLVPTYALIAWRSARGPGGFALSCALVLGVFFSFSKHAFCNHHFLVLGCAAVALGFSLVDYQATTSQSPSSEANTRVGVT
jgi:4-amino-4-deoxy-L-arabinose transferase-like glycosyltransferase